MTPTKMYPVTSSQISYVGYNNEEKELFVKFKNGTTYRYDNVPKLTYEELKNSDSVGKYFNNNIKGIYKSTKL